MLNATNRVEQTVWGTTEAMTIKTPDQERMHREKSNRKIEFMKAVEENDLNRVEALNQEYRALFKERIELFEGAIKRALKAPHIGMLSKLIMLLTGDEIQAINKQNPNLLLQVWCFGMNASHFEMLEHLWISGKMEPNLKDPRYMNLECACGFFAHMENVNLFPVYNKEDRQSQNSLYKGLKSLVQTNQSPLQSDWVLMTGSPEKNPSFLNKEPKEPLNADRTLGRPPITAFVYKPKPMRCTQQSWSRDNTLKTPSVLVGSDRKRYVGP